MRRCGAADSVDSMNKMLCGLALISALTLSACGKPDEAALAKGDAAFAGQTVDGQVQAVVSRAVMLGTSAPNSLGCASTATPAEASLTVHWSASADAPAKAQVEGEVAVCEADGAWTGIVFPAFGQDLDQCYVSVRLRNPREYQGPCRWGWVETAALKPVTQD